MPVRWQDSTLAVGGSGGAYGGLIAALRRVQADAIEIIEKADMRMAEERTAGQQRGEIATQSRHGRSPNSVSAGNAVPASAADLGLTRKQTFQARQLLKAEAIEPGIVRRALDDQLAAGLEPTRAAVREAAANGAS